MTRHRHQILPTSGGRLEIEDVSEVEGGVFEFEIAVTDDTGQGESVRLTSEELHDYIAVLEKVVGPRS
jgi:hypothetical protein